MLEELSRFVEVLVIPTEFTRAAGYLAGQIEVERQSSSSLVGEIVEAWIIGGGLADLERTADRYRSVTAEQVRTVAEQFRSGARAEGVVRGAGGGR